MDRKIAVLCMGKTWFGTPRLFPDIVSQGYEVHCIACLDTLAAKSKFVTNHHVINNNSDDNEWLQALTSIPFDLLLPGDDFAVDWLIRVCASNSELTDLVQRSMGYYDFLIVARDKYRLAQLAKSLHIPVPEEKLVSETTDMGIVVSQLGWPLVIKDSKGFAGMDVKICANLRQLRNARKWMLEKEQIFAQKFILGTPLMVPIACHEGKILKSFSAYKEKCWPPIVGPSVLVRLEECESALEYAKRLVNNLGLSGLISFDFVVDHEGESWLMECNLRPVPISHFNSLVSAWLSKKHSVSTNRREGKVALFPQAKISRHREELEGYELDVPDNDPPLLKAMEHEIQQQMDFENSTKASPL